ncbi:uncharacterized protein LOC116291488 isoform X2 [Actinia tenebrosa]|uniref:Uncharacterized protein LOC116291488 isoform X1 n=1 Tax=Actinia tenebrosa TaxID=6105 RepID=A0A6P8HPD7_ACTTE|nr:uncharacterized protein LOC116291488 isoform X1 [Actinia tenebrosa]XP_031554520.1 uncharacterized protein LOC116291488 isoform X2 [Actinia tenebrosa]
MDIRVFFSLFVLVLVGFVLMAEARPSLQSRLSVQPNGCSCNKQTEECGCCAHIKFDVLHVKVDDDACVNITYLPKQYGLSLTFAWNGKIIFNETVSATNPPPFCFGVPHVKLLEVCIRLYNISYNKENFGGCIELELEVLHIKKDFPLGCIYKNQLEDQSKYTPRDIITPRDILTTRDILQWIFAVKLQTVRSSFGEVKERVRDVLDRSQKKKNRAVINF